MVRCNDLLAVGSGALDMLSCMPSLRRVYLNGLPTMVDVEVRIYILMHTGCRSESPTNQLPNQRSASAPLVWRSVVGTELIATATLLYLGRCSDLAPCRGWPLH